MFNFVHNNQPNQCQREKIHIKTIQLFLAAHGYDILFCLLFLLFIFFRFSHIAFPVLDNTEIGRDYWTARHVAFFYEFPWVGPWNEGFGAYINSPLYYFFLAFLVSINDSILFLTIVNILLLVMTATVLYVLGKYFFSAATGFVAVLLYLVSWEAELQSRTIWQPHVMQPVFYISLFLLWMYHKTSRNAYALWSMVTFILAGALHNSVFSFVPLYCVMLWYLIGRVKPIQPMIIKLCLTGMVTLMAVYGTVLMYYQRNQESIISTLLNGHRDFTGGHQLQNLGRLVLVPINDFFLNMNVHVLDRTTILFIILMAIGLIYFLIYPSRKRKLFTLLLIVSVLQPIIFGSVFKLQLSRYHFIFIFGLFMLVIAEWIVYALDYTWMGTFAAALLIFFLMKTFSGHWYFLSKTMEYKNSTESMQTAVHAIADEVYRIQQQKNMPDINFFQIRMYNSMVLSPYQELFWGPLEKYFKRKFTTLTNTSRPLKNLNNDTMLFLICSGLQKAVCIDKFLARDPDYSIKRSLETKPPFIILLAEKNR